MCRTDRRTILQSSFPFFIFYVLVGTWTDIRDTSPVFLKDLPNLLNNLCLFITISENIYPEKTFKNLTRKFMKSFYTFYKNILYWNYCNTL